MRALEKQNSNKKNLMIQVLNFKKKTFFEKNKTKANL